MNYVCVEHLQFSTAFTDSYDFYFKSGTHHLNLKYNIENAFEIRKQGLRLFSYCANSFEMLTSVFSTSLLWIGGDG